MFPAIESALRESRDHLRLTGAEGTPIEAYLVQSLVVFAVGQFEQRIVGAIKARAARSGDAELSAFVEALAQRMVRAIKVSELAGVIGHFSDARKQEFQRRVVNTEAHAAFDSILSNRHQFAHQAKTITISLGDLERYYSKSLTVLAELEALL